jgi:hypothetical protein
VGPPFFEIALTCTATGGGISSNRMMAGFFNLGGAEEVSAISGVEIAKGEASLPVILGGKDGAIFWCDAGAAASLVKLFGSDGSSPSDDPGRTLILLISVVFLPPVLFLNFLLNPF